MGFCRFHRYVANIGRWPAYEGGQLDRFYCIYNTYVHCDSKRWTLFHTSVYVKLSTSFWIVLYIGYGQTVNVETLRFLMFCWPFITVYKYSETNMMHFLFNLLRIKGLYMFRTLVAHPQEVPQKQRLVYCMLHQDWSGTQFHSNPGAANWHNMHTVY
jgi:hypothetical protein